MALVSSAAVQEQAVGVVAADDDDDAIGLADSVVEIVHMEAVAVLQGAVGRMVTSEAGSLMAATALEEGPDEILEVAVHASAWAE